MLHFLSSTNQAIFNFFLFLTFQGSKGYTYTTSYIRTPYFSAASGYSYGPYQVTNSQSPKNHNSYPYNTPTGYSYNNFLPLQYKNGYKYQYDAKTFVKTPLTPTLKPFSNKVSPSGPTVPLCSANVVVVVYSLYTLLLLLYCHLNNNDTTAS